MNIVDVVIIYLFITAMMRGKELGVISQVFSTAGLVAGLFLGITLQSKVHVSFAQNMPYKLIVPLGIIIIITSVLTWACEYVGDYIHSNLEHIKKLHILSLL